MKVTLAHSSGDVLRALDRLGACAWEREEEWCPARGQAVVRLWACPDCGADDGRGACVLEAHGGAGDTYRYLWLCTCGCEFQRAEACISLGTGVYDLGKPA